MGANGFKREIINQTSWNQARNGEKINQSSWQKRTNEWVDVKMMRKIMMTKDSWEVQPRRKRASEASNLGLARNERNNSFVFDKARPEELNCERAILSWSSEDGKSRSFEDVDLVRIVHINDIHFFTV